MKILIRLLYYLPMEMTEKEEKKSELEIELEQTIDFLRKRMSEYEFEYNKQLRDIKFLEEENKNLKNDLMEDMKEITKLEKENKKLKAELEKLKSTYVYDAKQVRDIC